MGKSEEQDIYPGYRYQELFNLMSNDHGLTLLEDEMNQIIDVVRRIDSHSPTEPVIEDSSGTEFDTLQEGDWFQGTEEDYRKALELENHSHYKSTHKVWIKHIVIAGGCIFDCGDIIWHGTHLRKTQLTPEEFLRRAENTFKTK